MSGKRITGLKARVERECCISRGRPGLNSGGIQAGGVRRESHSNVCVCVYPSSFLGWRYGMNGNSGSCRQPN